MLDPLVNTTDTLIVVNVATPMNSAGLELEDMSSYPFRAYVLRMNNCSPVRTLLLPAARHASTLLTSASLLITFLYVRDVA